jgi:hypothetical protein
MPGNRDTDEDGLYDGDEVKQFGTNPLNPDTDYDSILDSEEIRLKLDPLSRDTDLDGTPDSIDVDPGRVPTPTATATPNPTAQIPIVRFSNRTYIVNEREREAVITVIFDTAVNSQVTVDYATSSGTATVGNDYGTSSGTLVFNPNQTVQRFTVPIMDDNINEPDEVLNLSLSNARGASLGFNSQATLTIIDDDYDDDDDGSIKIGFQRSFLADAFQLNQLPRYQVIENRSRVSIEVGLAGKFGWITPPATAAPCQAKITTLPEAPSSSTLAKTNNSLRCVSLTIIFLKPTKSSS